MTKTAALIGIATAGFALPAVAQTEITFHLDFLVNGYHAPFYIAEANGMYEAAGLDVTINPGRGSTDAISTVASGNAEIGFADAGAVAQAVANGAPVTVVAAILQEAPYGIISYTEDGIDEPTDLHGHSLAVVPAGATTQALPAFMALNEVDPDQVEMITYNFGATVPSFLSGQVDATIGYLFGEYLAARNESDRDVQIMRFYNWGFDVYSNSIIVNNSFLEENPEAVRAFVHASIEGVEYAMANPEEAVQAAAANTETPFETLLEQFEVALPLIYNADAEANGIGTMTAEKWDRTQRVNVEFGEQSEMVAPENLFTTEFLPQ
ncbi:MAG: ABC transporter substrate-binding protein [Azospirillaceae bacterium]